MIIAGLLFTRFYILIGQRHIISIILALLSLLSCNNTQQQKPQIKPQEGRAFTQHLL